MKQTNPRELRVVVLSLCGAMLIILANTPSAYAGNACGGNGERGCCVWEQIPSCDSRNLKEDLTPSCVNALGIEDCLCYGGNQIYNLLKVASSGVCRRKHEVGETCDPVFDPCLPELKCGATGFEGLEIQYQCIARFDEGVTDEACSAVYNETIHDGAVDSNITINFGLGAALTSGATASIERGTAYGRDGCYGCYETDCSGIEVAVGIGGFAAVGESDVDVVCDSGDSSCISFDGNSCVAYTTVSTGIDILGTSSAAIFVPGCGEIVNDITDLTLVGAAQAVELGFGVSPLVSGGVVDCSTTLLSLAGCRNSDGVFESFSNTPPVNNHSPRYTASCPQFTIPSDRIVDAEHDDINFHWAALSSGISIGFDDTIVESPTVTLSSDASVRRVACERIPINRPPYFLELFFSDDESSGQTLVSIDFEDRLPPVVLCPSDVEVCCGDSTAPADIGGMAEAIDTCQIDAPVISYTDADGSVSCPSGGTITRTWDAEDVCGNSTTDKQCRKTGHLRATPTAIATLFVPAVPGTGPACNGVVDGPR